MVPANRIGVQNCTVPQLKVMQEVITMVVFAGFAVFYLEAPLKLDYLWAGLCLVGAAYFMFRTIQLGASPRRGTPFVARRAVNLHGCAPASLCPPFLLRRGYPRERISYGSGAAYGARQRLRRAESQ